MKSTRTSGEVRALTGLRGVAASLVVLAHYELSQLQFINDFKLHTIAVDLFFCLSGFTLAMVYAERPPVFATMTAYGKARIARIAPLYYLTILWIFLAAFPLIRSLYPAESAIRDLIGQALFINAWPWVGTGVHWNLPAWSISAEMFCYLVIFPVLWKWLKPLDELISITVILLCMLVTFLSVGMFLDFQILLINDYTSTTPFAYYSLLMRAVTGFIAGYLVYELYRRRTQSAALLLDKADVVAITLLSITFLFVFTLKMVSSFVLIFFLPVLVLIAMNETSYFARLLSMAIPYRLGVYSYTIYLLHIPVMVTIERILPEHKDAGWFKLLLLAALMLCSALIYHWYEVPMRAFIRVLKFSRKSMAGWSMIAVLFLLPVLIPYTFIRLQSAHITPGELVSEDIPGEIFVSGWGKFDGKKIQTTGRRAVLHAPLSVRKPQRTLTLAGNAIFAEDRAPVHTKILLNGKPVANPVFTAKKAMLNILLPIPDGATSLELVFETGNSATSGSSDQSKSSSELTLSFTSIRINYLRQ